eukprot:6464154-Amphidinium_carterae.2
MAATITRASPSGVYVGLVVLTTLKYSCIHRGNHVRAELSTCCFRKKAAWQRGWRLASYQPWTNQPCPIPQVKVLGAKPRYLTFSLFELRLRTRDRVATVTIFALMVVRSGCGLGCTFQKCVAKMLSVVESLCRRGAVSGPSGDGAHSRFQNHSWEFCIGTRQTSSAAHGKIHQLCPPIFSVACCGIICGEKLPIANVPHTESLTKVKGLVLCCERVFGVVVMGHLLGCCKSLRATVYT